MDTIIDHSSRRDIKPPTTSLPIARFPTTAATGTGSSTKRTAGSLSSTTIKKTTSPAATTASVPARRRSGSSSSGWSGIRPVERQLMRPWLVAKIDEGIVKGLEWVDAAHTRFRIPWKHGSRQGWKTEQDACLFMHWAQHTGRYRGNEAPNAKRWKANFRCALNSLPDAREVKSQSQTKGQNAYRVYEFLEERKPKVQHARTSSGNKSKIMVDGVKPEMGLLPLTHPSSPTADTTQDVKHSLTHNSCTSGSPSGLGQQHNNEEPLEQTPYLQSPVPSPAASFSSTSSEDPYFPCSPAAPPPPPPPPAHQHTPNNISRNWMLHMGNDSYRTIFSSATSAPASLPVQSATTSTWAPLAASTNTNSAIRGDVTATSHGFPASPGHVMTSSTSFPATPVTSQSSMFNDGRSASQMHLTMDIGLSSHIDYDSGLGSPSSSGLGSPSSSHSDMDYACSDDGSDVSVEISNTHIQEMKRECLQSSQDEAAFQHYHHYHQRLHHHHHHHQQQQQQQQQPTHHHSPTSTHNNYNNLYQMAAQNRHHLQHNTSLNHHNNQFNLQSNPLAGDYGFAEALQNALCANIPEEMARLDPEEVESVLSAEPYLSVDYKITVKTSSSMTSTIEANLTADVHNYNCQT